MAYKDTLLHALDMLCGSPLVFLNPENGLVNGAISSAVILTFVDILVIKKTAIEFLVPYVDPALVLVVVLISISEPVRMAWQALSAF